MDQDVLLGGEFSMTCSAEGNGSVSIRWEKDGILLSNGAVMGNSLVYDEALASHAGSYVCVASNDEGETRAEATVTIFCKSHSVQFLSLPLANSLYTLSLLWCGPTIGNLPVLPNMWSCQETLFVYLLATEEIKRHS